MKAFTLSAFAIVAATGVFAQQVTVTEYYDEPCPTSEGEPSYSTTVTGTIISTYCPECMISSAFSGPSAAPAEGTLTTYTTVYSQWCPKGTTLMPVTYTVTESCSATGMSREASAVPQGFTVVTESCTVCEQMTAAVITKPVMTSPAAATSAPQNQNSVSLAAPSAPGATIAPIPAGPTTYTGTSAALASEATAGAANPVAGSAASSVPAAAAPGAALNAGSPGAGEAPAPYGGVPAAVSGSSAAGSSNSTISPPITPFPGAASSVSVFKTLIIGIAMVTSVQLIFT
ncbi:hypothetical protein MMC19_000789 [Ptychographa xylographoides]|nr:hypothetical protein [Ptychographa xylographoides]